MIPASLTNGITPAEIDVHIFPDGKGGITFSLDEGIEKKEFHWPGSSLLIDREYSNRVRIYESNNPRVFLFISKSDFRALAPHLKLPSAIKILLGARIQYWMTLGLILVGTLIISTPGIVRWTALRIPVSVEESLFKADKNVILTQFRSGGRCESPGGVLALNKILKKLLETSTDPFLKNGISLEVVDHREVNAFALPGGSIVVLSGLLDQADSPEEIAGVLAHELGHLKNRHVLTKVMRFHMLSFLMNRSIGEHGTGSLLVLLREMSFSREDEEEADRFGIQMLSEGHISVKGFTHFFEKMAKNGEFKVPLLSSHPLSAARVEMGSRFLRSESSSTPILTTKEWKALKSICSSNSNLKDPTD